MSLLEFCFSHATGYLSGNFSTFCLIFVLPVAIEARELTVAGTRMLATQPCSFCSRSLLLPTVLCFCYVSIANIIRFLLFSCRATKCSRVGIHEGGEDHF